MSGQITPPINHPQNWPSALTGSWSIFLRIALIRPVLDAPQCLVEQSCEFGDIGQAVYKPIEVDSISANYSLKDIFSHTEVSPVCFDTALQFRFAQNVAILSGDDANHTLTIGSISPSELLFVSEYHDGCAFWRLFSRLGDGVTLLPKKFSLVVKQVFPKCWLLDACFLLPDEDTGGTATVLFRTEWWHCRPGTRPLFDCVEPQLDAVKVECNRAKEAIDDLRDRLEGALSELDSQARVMEAVTAEEGRLRDSFEWNELGDFLQARHRDLLGVEPGIGTLPDVNDPIGDELSTISEIELDAGTLESEASLLADRVDEIADEITASSWTNVQYARGQRLLVRYADRLPPADTSFLGPAESATDNLNPEVRSLVTGAVRQYALATVTDAYRDQDYSPVIAAFSKCLERAFADVFETRKPIVLSDSVVNVLMARQKDWEYAGPPEITSVDKAGYCKVLSMLNGKRVGWSGTRNAAIAILLFGGRVDLRRGSRLESPNPLGIDANDPIVRRLPQALLDFQEARNGFVHHDLATLGDVNTAWAYFQLCMQGLLTAFYTSPAS